MARCNTVPVPIEELETSEYSSFSTEKQSCPIWSLTFMFVFFDSVCLCVCIEIKWKWSAWICEGFVNHIAQFCLRNVLILSHNMELVTRVSSELREDQLYFIYVYIYIYICLTIFSYAYILLTWHHTKEIKALKLTLWKLGEGHGTPLQYSCLETPMDGGAW